MLLFDEDFSWQREIPSLADLSCGFHATMVMMVDKAADVNVALVELLPPPAEGERDEEGEEDEGWIVVAIGIVKVLCCCF